MKENSHQTNHPQILRLQELIDLKGITKAKMARICGVSPQAVNAWFARGAIGKSSALKLSEELGVSVAWLLGEEVDETSGLRPKEKKLLELFNQLPEAEQDNMIAAFGMRLKELDDFTERYLKKRLK